jgi:hypothetical protein
MVIAKGIEQMRIPRERAINLAQVNVSATMQET